MPHSNRKILVVEDDAGIRDSLHELFASEGYEVLLAEDGLRGLEIVKQEKPSLVLLDLMMPVMDGAAFLTRLKNSEDTALAQIPVVLLTAAGAKSTAGCYAQEVLTKPIDIESLLSIAAKYCA